MKIIPLHAAEPTFLKLSKIEWGISALFALLVPLFFQSVLALLGVSTSLPLILGIVLVISVDVVIVIAKQKEQNFFFTYFHNMKIPSIVQGNYPTSIKKS